MKTEVIKGYAIIEILIAITIIAIVLTTIISGVSSGIVAISGNRNLTIAMVIARSKLNEFQLLRMRGPDINNESVQEYPGFHYTRRITRFEHELIGPVRARKVVITVTWNERNKPKNYSISYIYPER